MRQTQLIIALSLSLFAPCATSWGTTLTFETLTRDGRASIVNFGGFTCDFHAFLATSFEVGPIDTVSAWCSPFFAGAGSELMAIEMQSTPNGPVPVNHIALRQSGTAGGGSCMNVGGTVESNLFFALDDTATVCVTVWWNRADGPEGFANSWVSAELRTSISSPINELGEIDFTAPSGFETRYVQLPAASAQFFRLLLYSSSGGCAPPYPDSWATGAIAADLQLVSPTSVGGGIEGPLPGSISWLGLPVPNPTKGPVMIDFSLAAPGFVRLAVYDTSGRLVSRLADGPMDRGEYVQQWNPNGIGNGIYFLRLEAAGTSRVAKVVLAR